MSRIVVCDTGPLIHLSEADAIHLLKLPGEILIPPAVATEITDQSSNWDVPRWIQIRQLDPDMNSKVKIWINKNLVDPGEAEAIGLALQERSNWLLTDDAEARRFAEGFGLEVHGSIGLLLWAVATGHFENRKQARQILDGLRRSSLWISERVLKEAALVIDQLI